jgi:hypothetical protein
LLIGLLCGAAKAPRGRLPIGRGCKTFCVNIVL